MRSVMSTSMKALCINTVTMISMLRNVWKQSYPQEETECCNLKVLFLLIKCWHFQKEWNLSLKKYKLQCCKSVLNIMGEHIKTKNLSGHVDQFLFKYWKAIWNFQMHDTTHSLSAGKPSNNTTMIKVTSGSS